MLKWAESYSKVVRLLLQKWSEFTWPEFTGIIYNEYDHRVR